MADLALGSDRPYSVVATVVHRGGAQCKLAQLDLHLTTGDVRLRFLDRPSLAHFCRAVSDLADEVYLPGSRHHKDVWTRLYTDHDQAAHVPTQQFLAPDLFGPLS